MPDPRDISIDDFNYDLPDEKIAKYPLPQRDGSRLLVWNHGTITDAVFGDLASHVPSDGCMVFNQSRVMRARLFFSTLKGAPIEVFCLEPEGSFAEALQCRGQVLWRCMVGRLKKWGDEELLLQKGNIRLRAAIAEKRTDHVLIRFSWLPAALTFDEVITALGDLPVPPYLNRRAEVIDEQRYQTIYATEEGSVAAPTAGLHFTPAVLRQLGEKQIVTHHLTLHVGSGTFKPVKSETLRGHSMHTEWLSIEAATLQALRRCRQNKQIIAVGTTSLRALESLYWLGSRLSAKGESIEAGVSQWEPYQNTGPAVPADVALAALEAYLREQQLSRLSFKTGILIAPPYNMKLVNGLITNFHQPRSTLLLLVAAFAGDNWHKIYSHALAGGYRFLSYGDSSLLLK